MKTGLSMFICLALLALTSPMLEAGVVGDINNDGKVGLTEAINALQVTAGLRTQETSGLTGEHCWNFSNTVLGISGTLRLGVTHIGGGHNLCSGYFTVKVPINKQFPAYGNIEIVGESIYLTITFTGQRNENIGIDMIKAILDSNMSNGTFKSIGVYVDAVELSEGTLTSTTCQ